MNAPPLLNATLAILMVLLAAFALWRIAMSRATGVRGDLETDLLVLAAAVAVGGLLESWARTLPRSVWTIVFAAAAVYFTVRAVSAWANPSARGRMLAHAGGSLLLVYAFAAGVAPSTLKGSTAGQYVMAGMPGMYVDQTIAYPALGLVGVLALVWYATTSITRLSPGADAAAASGGSLAPRSIEACRILIALTLAYAILGKLV